MRVGSCNLRSGHVDVAALAAVEAVDAWVLQEAKYWDRDGFAALHQARHQIAGPGQPPWSGWLALSAHHGCHIAILVRERAGLRVVVERHDQGPPWWHVLAHLVMETEEFGRLELLGAHLAPGAPRLREVEAQTLGLFRGRRVVLAGDFNANSASGPDLVVADADREKAEGKRDRSAARAVEAAGFVDIGALLAGPGGQAPTVGHYRPGSLAYPCDRIYTTLPPATATGFEVLHDLALNSDHLAVVATLSA